MGKVRFPGTNVGLSSCLKYLVMSATRSLLSASRKRELLPTRLESAGATLPGSDFLSADCTASENFCGGGNGKRGGGVDEKEREERRQCWNGHKHVLQAHMSSKHSYT